MDMNFQDRFGSGVSGATVALVLAIFVGAAFLRCFARFQALLAFVVAYSVVAAGVVLGYASLDPWRFFVGAFFAICAWIVALATFFAVYLAATWAFGDR